ncbi:hypothetical protein DL766_007504 [Monosporascus sp. MC13-8B]|uniref:DUF7924 domain-containing protein n=1 Tax=Monosporascus cannonballus TaxID=155416 RepID=A0ABY0HDJ1_9PEZI|nr:hypothetical protein DL762_003912 [Monosporascus cannonballus]RYO94853.1 hypothetical protein DL763_003957 [Monosporascus cannonballus]RYP23467.1 hypothetical protein DL766_007504 [Monosporascus sp. MC13-8B]
MSQDPPAPIQSKGRKRKQSIEDAFEPSSDSDQKRQRTSRTHATENAFSEPAVCSDSPRQTDPIAFWTKEGRWPEEQYWPEETSETDPTMEHLLARKKSSSNLSRKRSNSATSITPSDQKPREEKSAPYRDARYPLLLQTKGSYMDISELGITDTSKHLVRDLLSGKQSVPKETLFDDDIFVDACRNLENKNEARIIQDILRLIVPSAESLALRAKDLRHLIESVNEGWNNSIPLTGTRPQPDYSVGFRREAFTEDQLTKLSPFIGNFIAGDQSLFMATYYMYFPFLTCEVKCGAAALDVADRQNAHSMTLTVRAVAELFRAVKREYEVHRQILGFSISHDHRSVRIYGHYPVINGKDTKYYRHPIHEFSFTALDGKEKWTAYRFTKNVYDIWMPAHFKMICSAIDQLPSNLDFDVASLPETGLSQDLRSQHLSQSDANSVPLFVEQDSRSSNTGQGTPGTLFTDPGAAKRRKGRN